ncbi:hypothetical protein MF669_001726 [Clostridium perfringens]|nr:hypothetical protein [Clostridium perfringens]
MESLNEIKNLIGLNRKIIKNLKKEELILFKKTAHKNLTIEIYTYWENITKRLIYNYYLNYKKILVDKKFMIKFFQHVNEKAYVRQLFLKSIEDNKLNITMENLCHSNNMTFKELEDLFKRLTFDISDLKKHINNFKGLKESIDLLKDNAIEPVFEEIKIKPDLNDYLEGYLKLVVDNRNTVAHQYNIIEIYNMDQFEAILNFIKVLISLVYEFCSSQILKKAINKHEKASCILYPIEVILSNSESEAIVSVRNSSNKVICKDERLYYLDRSTNIYRVAEIKGIRNKEGKDCYEMYPFEKYSLKIDTVANINKKHKTFRICKLNSKCDSYEYNISV